MLEIFVFIDILFVKQDIQKWLKTKICSFYGKFEKKEKKGQKFFDLPERGFEPWIFRSNLSKEVKISRLYQFLKYL